MKKKHADHTESFGVKMKIGDVVGCFLNADLNSISKMINQPVNKPF
jgi:hypothetical protein